MNLSISNIAWKQEDDEKVYELMKEYGFTGLEIAPTRIFPEAPYDKMAEAAKWAEKLKEKHGFVVSSMQSIWYGRSENIFASDEDRKILVDYTKKAIDFAEAIGCNNLVFGCPRNRNIPDGADESVAIAFFKELGGYALEHHTVIGMEANPPMYNTNFVNDTKAAIDLIKKVDSKGFKLNLDIGTMIAMDESLDVINGNYELINHVHISEPGLKAIEERDLHKALFLRLANNGYNGFVSVEMGNSCNCDEIENVVKYMRTIAI